MSTPKSNLASFTAIAAVLAVAFILAFQQGIAAQTGVQIAPAPFRIGEKLTYSISFENFGDVGFAEIQAVSRGKLGDRDAMEFRSRVKTRDILSAAFYTIDETRTVFTAPDTGMPLIVTRVTNAGGLPRENVSNFLTAPAIGYDLISLIYRARTAGGNGVFSLQEGDRVYNVTMQSAGSERVRTDAGEFDAIISTVQSDYFTEGGVKEVKISFTNDEARLPVLVRFKTDKGDFTIRLVGIQYPEAVPVVVATPVPVPVSPNPTPKPSPTVVPYVPNQPLSPELAFPLGESLRYRVTVNGQPAAVVLLEAKERGQFRSEDSLLLSASVVEVTPGNTAFTRNDSIRVQVNPVTLSPQNVEIKFAGQLSSLNQTASFDQQRGVVTYAGVTPVDAPVGTHSVLSLLYAIRSFNLKPSKVMTNPVNDTRVAVFWDTRPVIFTLRPSEPAPIDLNGAKVPAQLITVSTGSQNPVLDNAAIKVWLSMTGSRVPLRISAGQYVADLIVETP